MAGTLFSNARIFDGVSNGLSAPSYVAVVDGSISAISTTRPAGNFEEVDLAGRTLMPGLIDAHFHAYAVEIDFAKLESYPVSYIAQRGRHLAEDALARGFTSVRDVGGADWGLWKSIEEGYVKGPRLFYCGRAFSQTGGHGDIRSPHIEDQPCGCTARGTLSQVVDGPEDLRVAAREALRQGAHHLKIFVSGGISSPSDPIWMLQFSDEEIKTVVEEAARKRAYVVAHAYTAETITRAVKLGVRSIEHANLIDEAAAEAVAAAGAFVVPTLVTYESFRRSGAEAGAPQFLLDKLDDVRLKGLDAIRICRKAGVKLGFGTDLLGVLHRHQLEELTIRSEVETPFEVLNSATAVNADLLQMTGKIGVIKEGAFADMLVIDGNPLEDLSLFLNGGISQIWKGGVRC